VAVSSDALAAENEGKASTLRYLFVVGKWSDATRIYQLMGEPADAAVSSIEGDIQGRRADFIIIDDCCHKVKKHHYWSTQSFANRLNYGGTVKHAVFDAKVFDWGNQTGIVMRIGSKRQAIRFRKPEHRITSEDWLQAKAKLFNWYIRNTQNGNTGTQNGWPSVWTHKY